MTMLRKFMAALLAALLLAPALAPAQDRYSQPELDRLLAPVALYPDSLLSQVLMAATYPADVVEAARWSRANAHLAGEDAVRAADDEDWDPSVKSLLAFPHLLQRMDEKLDWTRSLGEAFLAQEPQVMDTVQQLRRRAHAAGHLRSDERILVQPQGHAIAIAPVQPQLVYVPYYDPLVVYGPWWWPAYQPVYWAPWPGYVRVHRPGLSVAFWWGAPARLSLGFFFGGVDWHYRQVRVVHVHSPYVHVHRHVHLAPGHWRRDGRRERLVVERRVVERPAMETRIAAPPPARAVEAPRPRREAHREREHRREPARVQAPQPQAPQVQAPQVQAPQVQAPQVRAPQVQAPQVQEPRPEGRRPEAPRHDTHRREAPRAQPHPEHRRAPALERATERPAPRAHMPAPRGEPRGEARNERARKGGERS
jgi:hypothetical protein